MFNRPKVDFDVWSENGADVSPPARGYLRVARATRHLQGNTTTLEGLERAHIVAVLEEANWLVGSPRGAAARLGMMRTTLLVIDEAPVPIGGSIPSGEEPESSSERMRRLPNHCVSTDVSLGLGRFA